MTPTIIGNNAKLLLVKQWIIANRNGVYDQGAVDALNAPINPAFLVYRSSVPMSEIMLNGFDWARVDNLSVGKARIWDWMKESDPVNKAIDPSKANIRAGINAVWVGTAADLLVRAAVYAHCHRAASVAEKLFAVGAGTNPDGNGDGPGVMPNEGPISLDEVIASEGAV